MKAGDIFLIFFLLVSAHALQPGLKSFLSLKGENASIRHTHLGKIIMSLAQMGTKDGQFDALYDALDLLLSSLQSDISTENANYQQSLDLHQTAVDTLTQQIEDANSTISTAMDDLNTDLYQEQADLETQITTISATLQSYQQQLTDGESQREEQQEENSQNILDFTEAINAINDALSQLRSLAVGSSSSSFIQKRYEDIKKTQNLLKISVSRVKHAFYADTLIQTMSYLGEKEFIDQDTLEKVINLLVELEDSFSTKKQNLADYDDQQQLLYENQQKAINGSIDAQQDALDLANGQLNDVQTLIAANEDTVQRKTVELNTLLSTLNNENSTWSSKESTHATLIQSYNDEIATINQAINALQQGGVVRGVAASSSS